MNRDIILPFRASMRTRKYANKYKKGLSWNKHRDFGYSKSWGLADKILKGSVGKDFDETMNKIRPLFIKYYGYSFFDWYKMSILSRGEVEYELQWKFSRNYNQYYNNNGKIGCFKAKNKKFVFTKEWYEKRDAERKSERSFKLKSSFGADFLFNKEKHQFYLNLKSNNYEKLLKPRNYIVKNIYETYYLSEKEKVEYLENLIKIYKEYNKVSLSEYYIWKWKNFLNSKQKKKIGEKLVLKQIKNLQKEELKYRVNEFFYKLKLSDEEIQDNLKEFLATQSCDLWKRFSHKKECPHF